MDSKRWTDFTPGEKSRELKNILQSSCWQKLPTEIQENILTLLAEYSGQYSSR